MTETTDRQDRRTLSDGRRSLVVRQESALELLRRWAP
jgi:hypothetical protein